MGTSPPELDPARQVTIVRPDRDRDDGVAQPIRLMAGSV